MQFGADEAGRGPVLGSMFVAAVFAPGRDRLPDGVDDSKRLTPGRREELAERIRDADGVRVGVAEVPPDRIDEADTDMNALTVEGMARAIDEAVPDAACENGTEGVAGVVDACDTNEARFATRVAEAAGGAFDVTAEHGADESIPVVGAASIVAKVERDAQMERLADEYGPVGSGYPCDATTRSFLEGYVDECGSLPPFARASWQTSHDALARYEQSDLGEF